MKQGVLPFQYEQEKRSTGMTALSGLIIYLELLHASGLKSSIEHHVGLREYGQGWTDSQIVNSLILLNLAGGESVVDLDILEKDAGFCRVVREVETWGMGRRERRALEERWRMERRRSLPSESAVFRYLEMFHDAGEEARREAHRAFIPSPNEALRGLHQVNADLLGFVQSPFASEGGYAGHGRDAGGDAQAGGALQLQKVQGIPAANHPVWGYGAGSTGQRPS